MSKAIGNLEGAGGGGGVDITWLDIEPVGTNETEYDYVTVDTKETIDGLIQERALIGINVNYYDGAAKDFFNRKAICQGTITTAMDGAEEDIEALYFNIFTTSSLTQALLTPPPALGPENKYGLEFIE